MSVSGFSTHSSAESDESIAFSDNDEIPPQGSLVPVLQHLLEEKGGTEAIQDMLAGLGLVTLARLDKDAAAGAATTRVAQVACDDTRCAGCQRLAGGHRLHCSSCRCTACLFSCGRACRLCRHVFCNPCFTTQECVRQPALDRPRLPGPCTGQPADGETLYQLPQQIAPGVGPVEGPLKECADGHLGPLFTEQVTGIQAEELAKGGAMVDAQGANQAQAG